MSCTNRKFRSFLILWLSLAAAAVAAAQARAATITIDTTTAWDGQSTIGDFGKSGFSGWGQTFTVPDGAPRLDSFTMHLQSYVIQTEQVDFTLHIVPFQDTSPRQATGPIVWSSDQRTMGTDVSDPTPVVFEPMVHLSEGDVYLALLFADNHDTATGDSRLRVGYIQSDVYPGGRMAITQPSNGSLDDLLASTSWSGAFTDELAFIAVFNVPEPGALGMATGVLLGLLGGVRRRR